jgi:hypothetical protein
MLLYTVQERSEHTAIDNRAGKGNAGVWCVFIPDGFLKYKYFNNLYNYIHNIIIYLLLYIYYPG